MRTFTRDQGVEQLRIKQAFADSTIAASHTMNDADAPTFGMPFHDNNAWRSHTARISTDAAYAQALQNEEDVVLISSQQCAWNLAVAEERILLDAELARSLQEAEFNNWSPTDGVALRIPENLRVQESINLASNHVISKGKARLIREGKERRGYIVSNTHGSLNHLCEPIEAQYVQVDWVDSSPGREHLTCGICMEPFQIAQTNLAAPLSAKSSSRLPYGLHLPCPGSHAYCTACLAAYIRNKLDPEGNGGESIEMVVFPIRCPECPTNEWPDGIPDEVAERVLSASEIVLWRHRKLLDSLPRYFCPNPRCSVLVQLHDDPNEPQAVCPSCSVAMCVPCGVVWHQNLTCEEYQALPLDERSPEDQKTMQLMKVKDWRRCPNCSSIIELTVGCNHMICRCKAEFCFRCGSLWDVRRKRCSREPPCALWDEDLLLDEGQRNYGQPRGQHAARPFYDAEAPPPYDDEDADSANSMIAVDNVNWMYDRDTGFTMIRLKMRRIIQRISSFWKRR